MTWQDADRWFAVEKEVLTATVAACRDLGRSADASAVADRLASFLLRQAAWDELHDLQTVARDAAADADDQRRRWRAEYWLAQVALSRGQLAEASALFRRCADAFADLDAPGELATVLAQAAFCLTELGDTEAAARLSQRALATARAGQHAHATMFALQVCGAVAIGAGDHAGTLRLLTEALAVADDLGERYVRAMLLNQFAIAATYSGQLERAGAAYRESLELLRSFGDRHGTAWMLNIGAGVERATGNFATAVELDGRSRDLFTVLGDRRGVAWATAGLAADLIGAEQPERALEVAEQAMALAVELGLVDLRSRVTQRMEQARAALS